MDLRGWDYTGRNIGPDFHRQICRMFQCLSDPDFVKNRTWGGELQDALTGGVGVASSGVIRTLKRLCENFGFLNQDAFSDEIDTAHFLTKSGVAIFQAATIEQQLENNSELTISAKTQAAEAIKSMYEEIYCDALLNYKYQTADGFFSPLRATLRALNKYPVMDKWEWYLLNTCVRHNDDADEEAELEKLILQYRKGILSFSMNNVIEKPKGHQYIPQYFEYAGLVSLTQRSTWSISNSDRHKDIQQKALSAQYLNNLQTGGL